MTRCNGGGGSRRVLDVGALPKRVSVRWGKSDPGVSPTAWTSVTALGGHKELGSEEGRLWSPRPRAWVPVPSLGLETRPLGRRNAAGGPRRRLVRAGVRLRPPEAPTGVRHKQGK